jgi:GNAT superfamily N-acetyltransferase
MRLKIRPLTPDLLPALEELFADGGPCSRCWCMYWRIGAAYRKRSSTLNHGDFARLVRHGPPPGLLALNGDLAVGWCQVTPRDELPWLDRGWRLKRTDDLPVWSLSCFYIRKDWRRKGVTAALIAAAAKTAKKNGAPALEAYPLDADLTPSSSGTGYLSTFLRAGFTIVARHTPPRPIVRLDLGSSDSKR